jgi:MoaA/NifB/PqqE/SkfB family radical SAM enzyme
MTTWWREFFRGLLGRKSQRFQYLQVEVTTRCNLSGCRMCPRSAFKSRWQSRDLTWQTFERLVPSFTRFEHVHLSGWGEPLVHPRLWDMARAARAQGCRVSLTTNGQGLTEAVQGQVLKHLDMIAISIDAARAATYEMLRPGADFERLTRQITSLCTRKRALRTRRPEVVLLFMKMQPNLAELPEFLKLAVSLGADRVNATNLDYIPSPEIEPLALITAGPPAPEIETVLHKAEQKAHELGVSYRNFTLKPNLDLIVCDAQPLKNAFVTACGEVTPCVYLGLPVLEGFTRRFFGLTYAVDNYSYGNIEAGDFLELCCRPAHRQFIDYFQRRIGRVQGLLSELLHHGATLTHRETTGEPLTRLESHYSWPPACRGCYKTLGF